MRCVGDGGCGKRYCNFHGYVTGEYRGDGEDRVFFKETSCEKCGKRLEEDIAKNRKCRWLFFGILLLIITLVGIVLVISFKV